MRIVTLERVWAAEVVEEQTTRLMSALSALDTDAGISIFADTSPHGIMLTLACMRLGLRTAICPVREPPAVISAWLVHLGIKLLISSVPTAPVPALQVSELITMERSGFCDVDRTENFHSLLRTSGTTGMPKTASLSARAHMASARAVNDHFSFDERSSWALNLPLNHVGGLSIIFRAAQAGATIFLSSSLEEIREGVRRECVSHLSLVPTQFARLLSVKPDLKNAQAIVIGGDALPSAQREVACALGLPVHETYGLTETASMIWAYDPRKRSGGLLPHAKIGFCDGEILVGGASLFDGYVGHESESPDGFFATGDLGHVCDGELIVDGRKHHRIISGGENIQAEEIERAIELCGQVDSCVVVALADSEFGMRPCAIIRWTDAPLNKAELRNHLKLHLASYKIPQTVVSWPHHAPATLKKPRMWLQQWATATVGTDKTVIVGA